MKTKSLKRLVASAVKSMSRDAMRPSGRVPANVEIAFRTMRPCYLYSDGVRAAYFRDASVWRETGEYVGFYERAVRTPLGVAREKYAWVLRNGRFVEVRQFGLRDVSRRIFVGS